jgi:LysR family transcriptional regulator, hydrogen peroxide-inducible genes activator
MEMHQVRYFLAVAEHLNFTRAAEKCNVAQPSLTRAIKLLEEELGGALFHRERANTHLSELGRTVLPHLKQVWSETQATKSLAAGFRKLARTKLRIGVMCTVAPTQLVDFFVALQSRHPGIELEIADASGLHLHEQLLAGDLEVAIYCTVGKPADERTHQMPLFREQMMIVVQPDHPLATKNAVRVTDLEGQNYLHRMSCEFIGHVNPHLDQQGVKNQTVYRSERDDWILAMAAAGMGYAFLPASSVAHPGVVMRPLIDPEFWREVNLVTVRGRPHSPAVGAFVREAMRASWMGQAALSVRKDAILPDIADR